MKPRKSNYGDGGNGGKDDSGQMIILAGFLIALILIALAAAVGSTFYSQSSPDDTGLSQLSAQVSDQVETAEDVGLLNIVKGNENATRVEGRNETEICNELENVTIAEVRDQMALTEDEVLLDIELVGDCDQFDEGSTSYAMGQEQTAPLPGVTVDDPVEEEGKEFSCEELRNETCVEDNREDFHAALISVIETKDDDPYLDEDAVPDDYGHNPDFDYTEDKIYAMNNVSGIDLDDLPGSIDATVFAETCVDVDIEQENLPDCTEIRGLTNLSDTAVNQEFQDELVDVVMNETPGSGIPSDYNESNESTGYEYTEHKKQALENTENDTDLDIDAIDEHDGLSDHIDDDPNYTEPVDLLAECVRSEVPGEVYDCEELRGDDWVDLEQEAFLSHLRNVTEERTSSYEGGQYSYVDQEIVPQNPEYNESKNPSAYDYTQDKVDALESMDSVDLDDDLPDRIEPEEFADCLGPSLGGESFSCEELRQDSGYTDNVEDFRNNLTRVIDDDLGEIPEDYNETENPGAYDYQAHKIEAFEDTDGITRDDISDITGLEEYDDAFEALADCIELQDIGRPPADVVFSIDTTGSMGLANENAYGTPPGPEPAVGPDYNDDVESNGYFPDFSKASLITQGHNERVEEYPNALDPYDIGCYMEYEETGVEFPRNVDPDDYGDSDEANRNWCPGAWAGDTFTASEGEEGEYVYYYGPDTIVEVIDIPGSTPTPPSGIPTEWTQVTEPGVDTNDQSQYPVNEPEDCQTETCETRRLDPGSINVGDVLQVDHTALGTDNMNEPPNSDEPVTAEVTGFVDSDVCVNPHPSWGCSFGVGEEDDVWEIEYEGETYHSREDALSVFQYRWQEPPVQVEVEYEDGSTEMTDTDDLTYVEYRWWPPDRLYLTQMGARAALDDLVPGEDRVGLVEYSTAEWGDASTLEDIGMLDSGYRQDLKVEIDELRPGAGTDITAGIQEARTALDIDVCEGTASRNAECHIVVMTDGEHNQGYPQPEDYVSGNHDYEDIYIHSITLGEAASQNVGVMEEVANHDGSDSVRPEGVAKDSTDPEDARDIFEDIVGEIHDTGEGGIDANGTQDEFVLPNETLDTPGIEFNVTDDLDTGIGNISLPSMDNISTGDESGDIETNLTASGGAVEEIFELNMNITSFTGAGSNDYSIGLADADEDGNEDVIWRTVVEINPEDEDGDTLQENGEDIETQVRFESDIDDDLEATFNSTTANLSEQGYVKIDLIEQEFELHNGTDVEFQHPDHYDVTEALTLVDEEASGEGVTGDGLAVTAGPDDEIGSANGTFALDLMPVDGNFSKIADGELEFGDEDLEDVCDQEDGDIVTCGADDQDNDPDAYASAQIKEARFTVTVEGPDGIYEDEVVVDLTEVQ